MINREGEHGVEFDSTMSQMVASFESDLKKGKKKATTRRSRAEIAVQRVYKLQTTNVENLSYRHLY